MEHLLYSKPMLQAITEFSENEIKMTDDMMEEVLDLRAARKAYELMQNVFFGSLELEMFGGFDPNGEESLVALQKRVASQYIPHDMPNHKDLSPLLRVLQENANGTNVGCYRYFYGDICSAGLYNAFPHGFTKVILAHNDGVREVGREIREKFLDIGAPIDPKVLRTLFKFFWGTAILARVEWQLPREQCFP